MTKSGIKSIAAMLNLSPGTVSIVLNGRGDELRISRQTQARILAAAKQLGYKPNLHARRLRQKAGPGQTAVIGVLWSTEYTADVLVRFFDGIQHAMLEDDADIEVIYKPYPYGSIDKVGDVFETNPFHGVILFGAADRDVEQVKALRPRMPIVLFNRRNDTYSSVCVDEYDTGAKVARLFHARGHTSAGLVEANLGLQHHAQRHSGFVETCTTLGVTILPEHIRQGANNEEGGRTATEALLQSDSVPTALFFMMDSMAHGAYPVFERRGIRVPDDIEIVAYNDSAINRLLRPSLTVVDLPVQRLVRASIRLLLEMIDGRHPEPVTRFEETFFVYRETCGGFPES